MPVKKPEAAGWRRGRLGPVGDVLPNNDVEPSRVYFPDGPLPLPRAPHARPPTRPAGVSAPREAAPAHRPSDRPVDSGAMRDRIAAAAYALWQQRGGDAASNWLEAEQQVKRAIAGGQRSPGPV